jgi:putative ABC transport system permease protein
VRALDRKLLRDVWHLKGQVLTVAIVVACGVAAYVALGSAVRSLAYSRDTYYDRYRFADVFCQLKRAPESLGASLATVPGVSRVYTRLVEHVMIPMPDMDVPAFGEVVSLPPDGAPPLNGLFLRAGRLVEPGRADEVVLLDAFADAHHLAPGATLTAVLNGKLRTLRVVGIGMSPEYVFGAAPGDVFGDPLRFAVLWMDRSVMAPAFRMEGAFDSVAVSLQPGASLPEVRASLDRLLEPYGGSGSYGRESQPSQQMVQLELDGLQTIATAVPVLFLAVAAFLLNVVLGRLVQLQRAQIAALKALGYRGGEIGMHYVKLVASVALLGAFAGLLLGAWMGSGLLRLEAPFFHFPSLTLRLDGDMIAVSVGTSLASALAGGLGTVRSIVRLPPAEAMRPPAPERYGVSLLERVGLGLLLGASGRMVLRELSRHPLRTLISSLGISLAVAILVAGRANLDSGEAFMDVQFHRAQQQDAAVSFSRVVPRRALRSLAHIDGVTYVEGVRSVPVRFRRGPVFRDSVLTGHELDSRLQPLLDRDGRAVRLPAGGVVIEKQLGAVLGVVPGDEVDVEVLEGEHARQKFVVTGMMEGSMGLPGHVLASELDRLLGEDRLASSALLSIDPLRAEGVYDELKKLPVVVGVSRKASALEQYKKQTGDSMTTMTVVLTAFAAAIAIGVVYNNARVSLSQRARELGSLRVLGYTRGEVSALLLGEMGVQVLLAIPLGLWLGRAMAIAMMSASGSESFRLPVVIAGATYGFAVVVVLLASLVSALIVRRRVDKFDLVAVLKTRE